MDAGDLGCAELDAWVALAQGHRAVSVIAAGGRRECRSVPPQSTRAQPYSPSTDWALAAPIIEREHIGLRDMEGRRREPVFEATLYHEGITWFAEGALPLIAAMRVYVRSRFDEAQLAAPPFT